MKFKEEIKKNMKENSGYLIPLNKELYQKVISEMIKPFKNKGINKVIAIDMKGLMYGSPIAYELKLPFVPIIKGGKVNKRVVIGKTFTDYSKKKKSLEIGKGTVTKKDKILLVDDVFETGAAGKVAVGLIEKLGGKIKGISIVQTKLKPEDEAFFRKYDFHYITKSDNIK